MTLETKKWRKPALYTSIKSNMQVDATRHLLYAALFHYNCYLYKATLRLIDEAELKLKKPELLYPWYINVDNYRDAGGDREPFEQMMKEIVAWPVVIKQNISITELNPEHYSAKLVATDHIVIPPLVLAHFLSFLCHYNMQNFQMATSVLHDLHILLPYDDGYNIHESCQAISWQILGICQEKSGDYHRAYQSYSNCLQQKWCPINLASILRIKNLER